MHRLIINANGKERRFAVLEENRMTDYFMDRVSRQSKIGNLYLGIVDRVLSGMDGAFVRIGNKEKGFLSREMIPSYIRDEREDKKERPLSSYIRQGEKLIVQVKKDETGSKYCRLTGLLELSGRLLVYLPESGYIAASKKMAEEERKKWKRWSQTRLKEGEGLIIRTAAEGTKEEEMDAELEALRDKYEELKRRSRRVKAPSLLMGQDAFLENIIRKAEKWEVGEIIADDRELILALQKRLKDIPVHFYGGKENIFSHFQLDGELEKLGKKVIWLKNGANIVIEETESATIIDVNTAKFTSKDRHGETIFETNRLAAGEIARQIMLRNIGGIILIDFINMERDEERRRIIDILQTGLARDDSPAKIYGFTALGLLEMARKRTTPSLREQTEESCRLCGGTGRVRSAETVAHQLERELMEYAGSGIEEAAVEATEDVIRYCLASIRLNESLPFSLNFHPVPGDAPYYRLKRVGK